MPTSFITQACRTRHQAMLAAAATLMLPTMVVAQGVSSDTQRSNAQTADQYWTPERLRDARPLDLRAAVGRDGMPLAAGASAPTGGTSKSAPGAPPKVSGAKGRILFTPSVPSRPASAAQTATPPGGVMPQASSSFGARYTTSRESTPTRYPASTVGKLYFQDPRTLTNYVCSASVLRPRIIMTAGHCVAHPSTNASGRYFYAGHYFVPALTGGSAPLGTWLASQLFVTNTWYLSDGSVPNAADEGIVVVADRTINGVVTKIASVTGYLGYITNALSNNNITMKGYPCNLDNCVRMETTNAQTFGFGGNNTYIYGSAMRGGESGGPWVQDYGVAPVSNPPVLLGNNYLAAVTSYGPVATEPAYLGASQLDGNFTNLLNSACAAATGNC